MKFIFVLNYFVFLLRITIYLIGIAMVTKENMGV